MNEKEQIQQNTQDIDHIKTTLVRLETNHIAHIEKDMARLDKTIDKMDTKVWAILILLVSSVVIAFIGDKI